MPERTPSRPLRLLLVSAAWLLLLVGLLKYGAPLLPTALARTLSSESYSTVVQLVAMGVGLSLCWLLLDAPRRALGLCGARGRDLLRAALVAPAVHVVVCYAALGLALPTLQQELARGGVPLVRRQGGAVVRAMIQPSLFMPLLWAVVVSPVGEELLFRGALWGALQGLCERHRTRREPRAAEDSLPLERSLLLDGARWVVRSGSVATLATTLIFAALHAGLGGSQGIVRVSSAAGLALACGIARQTTGALAAPTAVGHWAAMDRGSGVMLTFARTTHRQ